MRKLSPERVILLGFAGVLVLLASVGVVSYFSTSRLVELSALGTRSGELLMPLQHLSAAVYQAESAQRGYLVTGEDQYLDGAAAAAQQAMDDLERLRTAAAGDPVLAESAARIERLVGACFSALQRLLNARLAHGPEAARALLAEGVGLSEMKALERAVAEVTRDWGRLLERDGELARRQGELVMLNFFAALALVMVVLLTLMTLVLREMSRRRSALAELARNRAQLQAIVDTAVDAIVVVNRRGVIERFNRAAERIFGYKADEVIGKNVSVLMPSPYQDEHDAYMERYHRTGERRIIGIGREALGLRKDGSVFPIELAVAEFGEGEQRRYPGLIRDISERKQAEQRQAQLLRELEAANEELKNFAYIASHDLKAPLRAIASLADWISHDYADKFDEDGKEQMRLLIGRVRRMDQLIDGILQYSRVGRIKEEHVEVPLNPMLAEVVDLLAPPPHIQVEVGPLPTVVAERTRIQQLFQNLISNAIRYNDKSEGRIEIGADERDAEWIFHVRDNGPGIEPRHWERIFQLFQTLQPRDHHESTGIGLALVKKIVEMYGGRVWVESTPGEGSTFYFSLPKSLVKASDGA